MDLQRSVEPCTTCFQTTSTKDSPPLDAIPLEEAPEEDLSPEELEQLLASVDPVDDVDPSKVTIPYNGRYRSVTGVIKMLRTKGEDLQADVLEGIATLGEESKKFFAAKKRRATATHQSPYPKQVK